MEEGGWNRTGPSRSETTPSITAHLTSKSHWSQASRKEYSYIRGGWEWPENVCHPTQRDLRWPHKSFFLLWLHCGFAAMCRLSPVAGSGGCRQGGFSSCSGGLRSYGSWALEGAGSSSHGTQALASPWHAESSWSRNRTTSPALTGEFFSTVPPGKPWLRESWSKTWDMWSYHGLFPTSFKNLSQFSIGYWAALQFFCPPWQRTEA